MKITNLEEMTKGWFVGAFNPSVLSTSEVEVAVKYYKAGDYEQIHYHKAAREITVIVSGTAKMKDKTFDAGTIVVIEPWEAVDFYAITDVITTVVKTPSVLNDKYLGEPN